MALGTSFIIYRLRMTQAYPMDPLLSLTLLTPSFDNVLLEHGGRPDVLPLDGGLLHASKLGVGVARLSIESVPFQLFL